MSVYQLLLSRMLSMAGTSPLHSQKTLDDLKKAFAEFQLSYPTFDAESLAALRAKEYARWMSWATFTWITPAAGCMPSPS